MLKNIKQIKSLLLYKKNIDVLYNLIILFVFQAAFEAVIIYILPIVLHLLIFKQKIEINYLNYEIDPRNMIIYLLIFLIVFLLKNLYNLFLNYYSARFISNSQSNLKDKIYIIHLNKTYEKFVSENSAEYLKQITVDVNNYINFSLSPLITLLSELLILIFIFITLLLIDLKLTLVFLILSALLYFFFNRLTKNTLSQASKQNERKNAEIIQYSNESFISFKEIYIYNLQNYFIENFKNLTKALARTNEKNTFIGSSSRILIECFFVFFILLGIYLMNNTSSSNIIIIFSTFGFALFRILPSLSKIFSSITTIKFGFSSTNNLYSLVKSVNNIKIADDRKIKFDDSINLVNINFSYNNKLILNNINIRINSRDFIGFIGDSGSGKTTLLNVILGIITPSSGFVYSNSYSIYDSQKEWHRNIGYVSQNINLIDNNIYKNIAFGLDHNLINKNKIDYLLDLLNLSEFKDSNINNLNYLGEIGSKLSGGQIQRVAIAKALYRSPKILILDEFTSALDENIQEQILMIIKNLNITTLMVTHRESSLKYCTRIFSLKNSQLYKLK